MNTGVPEYYILTLVMVDRGMIPTLASRNGEPIMGQHLPYYAGLIMQHIKSGKRYFLGEFNSEILLNDYLGFSDYWTTLPLRIIVQTEEFASIRDKINLISVKDLDEYLRINGLVKKRRDAEAMHRLASKICTCNF